MRGPGDRGFGTWRDCLRTGFVAVGLLVAFISCAAWVYYYIQDITYIAHPTSLGWYNYAMDRLFANVAVVDGVIGGIVAVVGFFLKPRVETSRETLFRKRWGMWVILGGVALLALGGSLFIWKGFIVGCLGMCPANVPCTCSFDFSGIILLITAVEIAVAGIAVVVTGVVMARAAAKGSARSR